MRLTGPPGAELGVFLRKSAGHLWQGRFRSPAIQCEGYLLSCGRYIECSPLEAGIVKEPWQTGA